MCNNLLKICFLLIFLHTNYHASAGDFSRFLSRLNQLPEAERQQQADSLRTSLKQYPIFESDTVVYLLCFSNGRKVSLAGDATNWKPNLAMTRIAGTNLWYLRLEYDKQCRVEYKLVVDDKTWMLDSLNHNLASGGFGKNSELHMPQYSRDQGRIENLELPKGSLDEIMYSKEMGESRKIIIYLPPGYDLSKSAYPLVVFHDGRDFRDYGEIGEILDHLADNQTAHLPVVAALVVPVKRDDEYSGELKETYSQFIVNELVPYMDRTYRILPGPVNHVTAGISNGGNIALWLGVKHSDVFGKVMAQSSNIMPFVMKEFTKKPLLPLKIYINTGTYDIPELIVMYQKFTAILKEKGYPFRAEIFPEGHNWGFWNNHTREALNYLLR